MNMIDFEKSGGLVPVIVQDSKTAKVLMLGYMNAEAWQKTSVEKRVTFFSRSKQRLWTKGETSGNFLEMLSYSVDCDKDTILIKALPVGPVCHTGADTCFGEKNIAEEDGHPKTGQVPSLPVNGNPEAFLLQLETVIHNRMAGDDPESYTASLFKRGIGKVAQKVGEEAVEVVIEAMGDNDALFLEEAADLMFHYLVLLAAKGQKLKDVTEVLKKRHK